MSALKEFADFLQLNLANLAGTYVQLMATVSVDANQHTAARRLMKTVVEALQTNNPALLAQTTPQADPMESLRQLECLSQTLMPVVTNLEAGKFLAVMLSQARLAFLPANGDASASGLATLPATNHVKQPVFERLSQIQSDLSMAQTADDILQAVGRHLDDDNRPDRIALFFVEVNERSQPAALELVTLWEQGTIVDDSPVLQTVYDVRNFPMAQHWIAHPDAITVFGDVQTDARVDENSRAVAAEYNTQAAVIVPLLSQRRWQGILVMAWAEPHQWTAAEKFVLDQLPRLVGTVVGSYRATRAQQNALTETEALYQVSAGLVTAQSYNDILVLLRRYTFLGRGADSVSLVLFDQPWTNTRPPKRFDIIALWNQISEQVLSPRYQLAEMPSIISLLYDDIPTLVEDVEHDPLVSDSLRDLFLNQFGIKSTIFMPLVAGKQWIGFINALYQTQTLFEEDDIRRLSVLAAQAAVAIQTMQRLKAAEHRIRYERAIREITAELRHAPTIDQLLKTAVNTLGRRLQVKHVVLELDITKDTHEPQRNSTS